MTARESTREARYLLLQIRLPGGKSSARVGIWRRLRKLGALGLGATWTLPLDVESRESFEWLRRDVEAGGGEALLFEARPDAGSAAALAGRRRGETDAPRAGSARGHALAPLDPARYRGRTWVTRPRPGVDRMASAWLIRRFVDAKARFEFAADADRGRRKWVPFDTFGAELGHQQGLCTFEVLARRFGVDDPAVRALGRTVHAVDLAEPAPDAAEAATVERMVAGLRAAYADDGELLAAGIALFEALFASARGQVAGRGRSRAGGERTTKKMERRAGSPPRRRKGGAR